MTITAQKPINSGFTAASTTSHVIKGIDLIGKVAIVTGGYSGLGLETVRTFLSAGARVIVPARDVPRAKKALEALPAAEVEEMDLLDPASIDTFAKRFLMSGLPLDILVNSAGIMAVPERRLDAQGNELHFATNHLGHFPPNRTPVAGAEADHGRTSGVGVIHGPPFLACRVR